MTWMTSAAVRAVGQRNRDAIDPERDVLGGAAVLIVVTHRLSRTLTSPSLLKYGAWNESSTRGLVEIPTDLSSGRQTRPSEPSPGGR